MAKTYTDPSGRTFGRYETKEQVAARRSGGGGGSGGVSQPAETISYFYNPKTGKKTYRVGGAAPPPGAVPISQSEYQGQGVSIETRSAAGQWTETRPGVFQRIEGGRLRTQYRGMEAEGFGRAGEVSVFQAERAASQFRRELGEPSVSQAARMNIPPEAMKKSAFDVGAEERLNVAFMRQALGQGAAESYLAPPGSLQAYIQQREFYGRRYAELPPDFKGYVSGVVEGQAPPPSVVVTPLVAGRIRSIAPVAQAYTSLAGDVKAFETDVAKYEQRLGAYELAGRPEKWYEGLAAEESSLISRETDISRRTAEYEKLAEETIGKRARSEEERFQALQEQVRRDQGLLYEGGLIREYQQRYGPGESPRTGLLYSKEFKAERGKVEERLGEGTRELYLMAGVEPPKPSIPQRALTTVSTPFEWLRKRGEEISASKAGVAVSNILEPVVRPDYSATEYLSREYGGRVLKPFTIALEKYERAGVKPPGIVEAPVATAKAVKPLLVGFEKGAKEYVAYDPGGVAVDFGLGYGVGKAIKVGGFALGKYATSGATEAARMARYGRAVKVGRGFRYAGYGIVAGYTAGVGYGVATTPETEKKGEFLGEEFVRLSAFIGGGKAAIQEQYNVPLTRTEFVQRGGGVKNIYMYGPEWPGGGYTLFSYIKGEGLKFGAPKPETVAKYFSRVPYDVGVQIGGGKETQMFKRFFKEGPYEVEGVRLEPTDRWRADRAVDIGKTLTRETYGVESSFKGDLPTETERLPKKGVDVFLELGRKYGLRLKGRFPNLSEMPGEVAVRGKQYVSIKLAGDIDLEALGKTPKEVVGITEEAVTKLRERGIQARAAAPEGGLLKTQVEVKQEGVWVKAAEFLGGWSPEIGKAKVLGYVKTGPTTIKEGVYSEKLAEGARGTIQGVFRALRTPEGYDVYPVAKRIKDIGSTFFRVTSLKESKELQGGRTEKLSAALEEYEAMYPYEKVYSDLVPKEVLADFGRPSPQVSMASLGATLYEKAGRYPSVSPRQVSVPKSSPGSLGTSTASYPRSYIRSVGSPSTSFYTSPLSPPSVSYPSPPSPSPPSPPSPSPPSPSYPSYPSPSLPSPPSPSLLSPPSVSPSISPRPFIIPGLGQVGPRIIRGRGRRKKRPYRYTPDVYNILGGQLGARLPRLEEEPKKALFGLELRPLLGKKKARRKPKKKAKRRKKR